MAKAKQLAGKPARIVFPAIPIRSHSFTDQVRVQELIDDQILIVCNLFPPTVRLAYRRFFETEIAARLSQPVAPKRGEATRTNERFSQHDEEFAAHLYQASGLADMPELVQLSKGRLMGLNPNIRIYRYKPGAFFGPHYDDSVRETIAGRKCESAWTLLIYLSDNLVGGETQFHLGKGEVLAPPVQDGMALLHRHGHNWFDFHHSHNANKSLLHEGLPVKSGVKWVLRSDLMFEL